jgi:hypothetical protein
MIPITARTRAAQSEQTKGRRAFSGLPVPILACVADRSGVYIVLFWSSCGLFGPAAWHEETCQGVAGYCDSFFIF